MRSSSETRRTPGKRPGSPWTRTARVASGRFECGWRAATVDIDLKTDEKGVETGEVELDIQPLPKKEGKAKPEAEAAETN